MDTRQQHLHRTSTTNSRPKEEQWLADAIGEHDISGALAVINIIKEKAFASTPSSSTPSFLHLDNDGNSFLFLSLANQTKPITIFLYDLLKDNDSIFLAKNKKNQTLLWQAAQNQDKEILQILLPKAISYFQKKISTEKFWFLRDINGNTPFHVVISSDRNTDSLSYLLKTISKIEDKNQLPNRLNHLTNKQGNTPLHIAAKMKNIHAIALLTQHGADWEVINDKKKNTFNYVCEYSIKLQQMLMSLLSIQISTLKGENTDKTYQYYVLNLYQQNLLDNATTQEYKENYLKLAALVSLKSLIIANSMINVPIRMALMADPATKAYFAHDDDIEIEIENETQNKEEESVIVIDDNKSSSLQNEFTLSLPKHKNKDKSIKSQLTDFIDELDAYILNLENNVRSSYWRPVSIILSILIWLIFWSVEIWMIDEFLLSEDLTNCNKTLAYRPTACEDIKHPANPFNQDETNLQLIMFSIFGLICSALFSVMLIPLFQKEGHIPKKEWKKKLTFLDGILAKLKNSQHNLPPDHNESIEKLQAAHDQLHSLHYPSKKEVLSIFKPLSLTSKKIRTDCNLGFYINNFSFFTEKKTALLNINNPSDESDEEKIPLLYTKGKI